MSRPPNDESAWQQQLLNHLYLNLAPSLPTPRHHHTPSPPSPPRHSAQAPCTVTELHSAAVATLRDLFSRLPVEYDILTLRVLIERFRNSFRVDLRNSDSEDPSPSQLGSASLPLTPVLLLALLVADDKPESTGDLLVKDATDTIVCEVCHTNLPLHFIGNVVLFVTWNFAFCSSSKCKSYLEVQEVIPLCQEAPPTSQLEPPPTSCIQPPPLIDPHPALSVSALQQSLRNKDSKRLDVHGKIAAVGEILRNGRDHLFLLQLADSEDHTTVCSLVIQHTFLLHLASLLCISEEYVFTQLRDMILNKGSPNQKRVLASSSETRVHLLSPSPPPSGIVPATVEHPTTERTPFETSSPPRKRPRGEGPQESVASPSESSGSGLLGSYGSRIATQCPDIQQHEISSLVSYRGTVTRVLLPEFGLYELDGQVRLYLTHRECLNRCRGVRCGAMLELHSAHVMKISAPHLKHTSGFYCCPLTTVRVVRFSKLDSPFHAFHPKGRGHVLAKRYGAMDVAWMTDTYASLRQKQERPDLRSSLALLDHTLHLSEAALLETSAHVAFLSLPHRCPLLDPVDLSLRPRVPSLAGFLELVRRRVASEGFRWWGGGEEEGGVAESSAVAQFAVSAQWTFGWLRSSDFSPPQLLIGTLQGSRQTGYCELADGSASLPVVCCLPSKRALERGPSKTHPEAASKTCPGGAGETCPGGAGETCPGGAGETRPEGAGKIQLGGLLMHFGSTLLLDKYSIFVEKTTEAGKSTIGIYLSAKECKPAVPGRQERPTGGKPSTRESPLMTPVTSHGAASVPQGGASTLSKNGHSLLFYFVVLNKNALRVTQAREGLPTACLFTVQTLLHTDAEVLTKSVRNYSSHADSSGPHACTEWGRHSDSSKPRASVDCGSEDQAASRPALAQSQPELPLRVVLDFPATSLHWYPYIHSGCLYSLTVPTAIANSGAKGLLSFESLRSEPCIVVEEGMEIRLLDASRCCSCRTPVEDVSELVSKLYLPRFTTSSGSPVEANPPERDQELVSLAGVVQQHGYRVDVETLSSGRLTATVAQTSLEPLPTATTPFTQLPHHSALRILALKIRSLQYPDSLMVYFDLKGGVPAPLGLLPGAVVTLHGMRVKSSRSGNVYCTNCASSSIEINSLEGVGTNFHGSTRGVTPEMRSLPPSSLNELMKSLLCGRLSRRMVCVRGTFVSVQQISLQFTCQGCLCVVVDGNCMASCLQRRAVLKAEARFIVEDGSAEAHVYLKDSLIPQALGITPSEWMELLGLVEKIGQVLYNKSTASKPLLQADGAQSLGLSAKERAQLKLTELASCLPLHQAATIYCQPFVSSAELKESIVGQKSHMVRLGAGVEYHILALPRLQLRAVALSRPVNYIAECERLLAELSFVSKTK